jgi:hypothetical protein
MELFTATGKLKKLIWQLEMFHVCSTGDTTHVDVIFKFSPHTRVNVGASVFFAAAMIRAFKSAMSRRRVLCLLYTKCTLHSNHRPTRMIFQHTKGLLPPERPFSHYIHSHRLAVEMWTTKKNNLLRKQVSCSFYLYRFCEYMSNGFPIINVWSPGVHYETPCILSLFRNPQHVVLPTKVLTSSTDSFFASYALKIYSYNSASVLTFPRH